MSGVVDSFSDFFRGAPSEQARRLELFRAQHQRSRLEILGSEWSYLTGGVGPETVLILHERAGDPAFLLFAQLEAEYRCVYPFIPPASSMVQLVDGLVRLLDVLRVPTAVVVGASFGGAIGQCFVRKYPERVSKLVLVNASAPSPSVAKNVRRARFLPRYLPLRTVKYLAKQNHKRDFPRSPEADKLFWDSLVEEAVSGMSRKEIVDYYDAVIDYNMNYDFRAADLEPWSGDVIILRSEDDRLLKPERQTALRELYPRAKERILHAAGRVPYLSEPVEFYRTLKSFL